MMGNVSDTTESGATYAALIDGLLLETENINQPLHLSLQLYRRYLP